MNGARSTRYNPMTRREEPWEAEYQKLGNEIAAALPRDRRLEGYTLAGAVEMLGRLLSAAETQRDAANYQKRGGKL